MPDSFRNILVPHDLSAHANRALALAASLAGSGGRLTILHVVGRFGNQLVQRRLVDDARRTVVRIAARAARARGGPHVRSRVVVGDPYREICDAARGADCIVMCTAGRTGIGHLVMGSVAEKVVRHSAVPVLSFRPGARVRRRLFESVLVPHDFSAHASEALRRAASLVGPAGRLRVLGVVFMPPEVPRNMAARIVADDRRRLARLVGRELPGRRVDCRVEVGDPYRHIVRAARGVDSIVMSTLGRTGLAHLVIGSVAEKVVRHAPVPVLTIHPAGARARRRTRRRP
jgi:nucleotide-binding universal stress UspA family protein